MMNFVMPEILKTSLNPHAALSRLYRHVVMKGEASKFCERVVQALVQAIGVYPPGSLVELTDGFTGIVSSINVHHPTKPTVLLYAPWLCRNDGLLVNLAKEHTLHIKQALHPKDVPEQVLAYLSPRRMSMFIHAEPISMGFNSRPSRRKKKGWKVLRLINMIYTIHVLPFPESSGRPWRRRGANAIRAGRAARSSSCVASKHNKMVPNPRPMGHFRDPQTLFPFLASS